jgi:cytochrome c biogenesis protein CcdA
MIFLISFLTLRKRKRKEILLVGLIYTATVFVTYTGLGLGAFRLITALEKYHLVSEIIRWLSVTLAGSVALFSFIDAIKYARGKKPEEMTLQLPKAVKKSIHNVINKHINSRSLIIGTIVTGFLVTLLEAVCTGQVYLPTIIIMTRIDGFRGQGLLWLLYYNFLFVLPLLIVMVAAYFGLTWERLANFTQKHLTALKVLLGVVMLGIAVYLGMS